MGKIRLMKQFMWGVAVYVIATGEPWPCCRAGSQAGTLPILHKCPACMFVSDCQAEHICSSSPCAAWWGAGSTPALLIHQCPAERGWLPVQASRLVQQAPLAGLLVPDCVWCHPHSAHCQPICQHQKA